MSSAAPTAAGTTATPLVEADRLIDDGPISRGQWIIIGLCAILSMLDGFDVQAIAFAAPEIRRDWGISAAALGPIFSVGLFGGMIGGFLIGPLADRFGPKRVLVLSTFVFGVATLATIIIDDLVSLGALRAVSGIGLGAAVPAIVATISAYSPRRLRATLVTGAFCIQLLGAVLGSLASAALMEVYGWKAVFYLGGVVPLLILPLVILLVPEPLSYLLRHGVSRPQFATVLRRIGRGEVDPAAVVPTPVPEREAGNSAIALFRDHRALATVLLMLTSMVGGTFFYFLANWLPSILRDSGHSMQTAVLGSTALNFGGLLGSLTFAWLIDRLGPYRVMTAGYVVGGLLVLVVALADAPIVVVMGLIFAAAFFGLGAQYCIPAATVLLYPAHLRGAGIGFVLGFARIGAVVGPLVGSYILLVGGGPRELFQFSGLCALGAAITVFLAYRWELGSDIRTQRQNISTP
jgi:AAHS family 4-hydroxybenzoate transporter-like MFS transporter